jgi:hypothetical protein
MLRPIDVSLCVQVKAEKHSTRSCFDEDGYCSSPRTPGFNEETAFSLVSSITLPSHSDMIGMLICCLRNYTLSYPLAK